MDASPEAILHRVRERDAQMCVLLQRTELLNRVHRGAISELPPSPEGMGGRDSLKARLAVIYGCQDQAETVLNEAVPLLQPPPPPSSPVASTPDAYTKAIRSLLSTPKANTAATARSTRAPSNSSGHPRVQSGGPPSVRRAERGDGGRNSSSAVTYRVFLERLTRSESEGFVEAIRLFLFSILGNGGAVNPAAGRPRASSNSDIRRETEEVEVYGSSFLSQRCAEFFLAMQNAMGVHTSWAELGYDSLVACREHLERFVMSKIHPLAFGSKLDGAVDASISARLQSLQFLTPHDLNVSVYAREETVLTLAQEELRKMGRGRCPGDIVSRVVRCCDTLFALIDQGRRFKQGVGRGGGGGGGKGRGEGDSNVSSWRPERDPAGTADDFLPVLIYVVLRARVPRLHSMCEYVQAFHSPVALMSRPGYCFVALRSAVEFLMTLNGAAVGMSEQDFRRRALDAAIGVDASS
ncbi:conserved unknown protein [Ectocarpus siliculosus]|uniref:VPS9 domain-containing protein n=1 Tax=Ectocarpus siliculosus TaxID=2880 RepID=D7FWH9_ECTSI|nr:conserved unknown protein [Ectocarpus siliculosus]|eukprot:CBJ32067.1 conserved unknown protein [Ectocarpus siliculosus]